MMPAIPTKDEFQTMERLAQMALKSGYLPASIKSVEQAVLIMLKGRELGIQPMQAFAGIQVIQGKPTVSPELMLSLIYSRVKGAIVDYVRTDETGCWIEARRPGGKVAQFCFTMEDAKRAELVRKGPWINFPAAMCRARCISAMARALFPDAIAGASYIPEEIEAQAYEPEVVQEIQGTNTVGFERSLSPQNAGQETTPPRNAVEIVGGKSRPINRSVIVQLVQERGWSHKDVTYFIEERWGVNGTGRLSDDEFVELLGVIRLQSAEQALASIRSFKQVNAIRARDEIPAPSSDFMSQTSVEWDDVLAPGVKA